eukprot:NODE_7185_length_1601_cov_3.571913.p1 GENE.NODE_7185_length_1601_cov_3.571913~~NODE_7185_length_1601_cov_3.571913.p1  ORF type:complete len:194 (-),score=55.15 NODE_7185_length_1601_cov_3.571913:530-1111(-)
MPYSPDPFECAVAMWRKGVESQFDMAPMRCYAGEHAVMACCTAVLLPIFMLHMWPMGLAGGDSSLLSAPDGLPPLQRALHKFRPSTWRQVWTKRLIMPTGAFTRQTSSFAFDTALLLSKLVLSVAATGFSARPFRFCVLHTFSALCLLLVPVISTPVSGKGFRALIIVLCCGNLVAGALASYRAFRCASHDGF